MKKRISLIITLLLLLALAGCSVPLIERTDPAPSESARVSTSTSAAERDENISFLQALSISLEEYLDEDGAFGLETIKYRTRTFNREVDLLFADRMYTLSFTGDLTTEQGHWHVIRHTNGQYWNTQDNIDYQTPVMNAKCLYAVADREDVLGQQDKLINDNSLTSAFFYNFYLLKFYNRYFQDAPEKVDFNGIPCWCYTLIREYDSSLVPAGSKERSLFYFRQDNWHFVYEQTNIITPDGTVIPDKEMRTLSGKEAEDFYREKADLFTDVDYRDLHGEHTLTVIIDPGEAGEITYRCPMNSGENIYPYFPDPARSLYLDRTGTVEAEGRDLANGGADVTVYAIKKEQTETDPAGTEPETVPPETADSPRETTEPDPPAFTEENITPYNELVADLAYAVLQRGSVYSLSGSLELTRSEAAARFKLDTDGALFEYSYLNNELLLEPVFEGTYDAENNVRYCKANQEEISRTLKALLDLEISREDFPEVYDSYESPLCIWNQNGLFLCVPMMGEAPGTVWEDLVLTEEKALLYADVFEPFNSIPTDHLVITLVPAENELGFTIESISLNPNAVADMGLGDGYYGLWTAMEEVASYSTAPGGRNYDAMEGDYTEGQEVTFTMKSSGRYIKFTKDYIETTFVLDIYDLSDGRGGHMLYNEAGYVIRVPVSPAIRNPMPTAFADIIAYFKWVFSDGPCELFDFKVQDGMVRCCQ